METEVPAVSNDVVAKNRNVVLAIYVLYALSVLVGITGIAGIIMAYIKRDDVRGTWLESHIDWQIKTFWWGLGLSVLGFITMFIIVGFIILIAAGCWVIYRVVKGWLKLNDGLPVS